MIVFRQHEVRMVFGCGICDANVEIILPSHEDCVIVRTKMLIMILQKSEREGNRY